ncbi:MAG TPA: dihydrolipoamide acetyltransferase family protein [Polyangiales bacterium]|nr:dihydrolipoamide acetyltransferase family protein [Polyangiales bacterium]
MSTTVTMPQLGESVVEGTIGKWLVKEGESVARDQAVVEVLTDKADSEVPSPVAGVVSKLLANVDDVVKVGGGLFIVEEGAAPAAKEAPKAEPKAEAPKAEAKPEPKAEAPKTKNEIPPPPKEAPAAARNGGPGVIATGSGSPSARKAAREQGVELAALAKPSAAIAPAAPAPAPVAGPSGKKSAFQVPPYIQRAGDQVIPFSRRRRIIADHMVYSKLTSPHVVAVAEVDIQATSKLRDQHKDKLKKEGIGLSFLSFVCAATVKALSEFKELNARVLDDAYVLLKEINLGVAVDTPDGLVVPVIKGADNLTVKGIARGIDELAVKARDGKLSPDDLAGKTFTVSNPGRRGNLHGGAIISQPNVGILRIGEIKKRVVVVEKDGEDSMAIHPVMYLSLSYDHRIVDGVHANGFLYRIGELLEQGDFSI